MWAPRRSLWPGSFRVNSEEITALVTDSLLPIHGGLVTNLQILRLSDRGGGLGGTITWLAQKSGANVGKPPTAANLRTIRGGPQSTLSSRSSTLVRSMRHAPFRSLPTAGRGAYWGKAVAHVTSSLHNVHPAMLQMFPTAQSRARSCLQASPNSTRKWNPPWCTSSKT